MTYSLEQSARIQEIRRKSMAGTASLDELREATIILREDRSGAQAGSTATRTARKASAAPVDTANVLAALKAQALAITATVHSAQPAPTGVFKL